MNEGISNNRLVRNAVVLASFILGEQSPEERLGSKIIKSFFDLNEVGIGEDLAKQFEVCFNILFYFPMKAFL